MILLACVLSGCATFSMDTPGAFIELEEEYSSYGYRSASADGVVVAVRDLENERRGTLEFWSEAIRNRMREGQGYALLEESDVQARGGLRGKQMRFGRDANGTSYIYWVTVFARTEGRKPRLWIIEAGGETELFEPRQQDVEAIIASFEPR